MFYLICQFAFLLHTTFAGDEIITPLERVLKSNLTQTQHYQLPEYVIKGSVEERRNQLVNSMKNEILNASSKNLASPGDNKSYSIETKTEGDCDSLNPNSNCHVLLIGRRQFYLTHKYLKQVVDTYTTDLKKSEDKKLVIHGIEIQRFHWIMNHENAIKMNDSNSIGPIEVGEEFKIKKCRNGLLIPWKCNTISYKLFKLDIHTYLLMGMQVPTEAEPSSYSIDGCKEQPRVASKHHHFRSKNREVASVCVEKFNDNQKKNCSDGTLTLVLFTQDEKSGVSVYELNEGLYVNSHEAKKMLAYKSDLSIALQNEYRVLSSKFSNLSSTN